MSDHCYTCHGPDEETRAADLRLDDRDSLLATAGASEQDSELLRRILTDDPDERMPPPAAQHNLSDAQIASIREWINAGAKWEAHWAFQPPSRPSVPRLDSALVPAGSNAIDYFVIARLSEAGLRLNPPASGERWLRRVTLDLTGVPPTLEEMESFLSHPVAAIQRGQPAVDVVDRLLTSPRYGERMAMEWLDAARYADTNGYQGDRERTMWPWRDWVVDAFNRNLAYDDFTIWQIAGDLLSEPTREQKLATGFCRNHMINGEGGRIPEENRVEYVFDQLETVGTVWLGLTLQCCRCHDHKFDPLTQENYFEFFDFFNQTPITGAGGDPQMAPRLTVIPELQQKTIDAAQSAVEDALRTLVAAEQESPTPSNADVAKGLMVAPASRSDEQWKTLLRYFGEFDAELERLMRNFREHQAALDKLQRGLPKVMVMQDRPNQRRDTFVLNNGLYNQPRNKVSAATPGFLPRLPEGKSDRLALAQWIVSPENPLTARVTVNRIWQMFFGTGIVKTSEDFGVQGEKPSHPALLDWLAVELIESGWNMKHLVKLITTSSTYRQSAIVSKEQLEKDPDNRLLSRAPRRRMPAWMIRDHALFVSQVAVDDLGGPAVKPYQPEGIWADASFGKKRYAQDHGEKLYRRSLYTFWRRIVGPTMFFDMARRQTCSVRKTQTNTPLHALVTLNDTTYVEAARLLAKRVMETAPDPADRISLAFRLTTGRLPTDEESQVLIRRQKQLQARFGEIPERSHEFLSVGETPWRGGPAERTQTPTMDDERKAASELASYTTVCLTLLNLDEALNK